MNIKKYKTTPIPNLDKMREKKLGYRKKEVVVNPKNEEVVDLLSFGVAGENYYFSKKIEGIDKVEGSIPNLFVRKTVADKILKINKRLKAIGLELFVIDAYRPLSVQNFLFNVWGPRWLKNKYPNWSDEKIEKEKSNYFAFGGEKIDPDSPPPHSTGGAVDITFRKIGSKENANMGSNFDGMSEIVFTDFYEEKKGLSEKEKEFRNNRRILYWAMFEEDFVNNPTEWWHFSYGDQMWAKLKNKKEAIYSNIREKDTK